MTSKRKINIIKEFWIPIFSTVLILILLVIVILPKVQEIIKKRDELNLQMIEIGNLSRKLGDLKTLSEPDLIANKDLLLKVLPPQKDIFYFMDMVKKILSDNNLQLVKFDFSPGYISSESGNEPKTQNIKIYCSGSFENIIKFFENSEKTIPLMSFSPFKLSGSLASGSAENTDFTFSFELASYYLPLPNYFGKIDSPLPKLSSAKNDLINEIKNYNKVEFTEEVFVPGPIGKEIPF